MIKDNNENILKSLHIFSGMKNKYIFEYQIMCVLWRKLQGNNLGFLGFYNQNRYSGLNGNKHGP